MSTEKDLDSELTALLEKHRSLVVTDFGKV